MKYGSAVVLTLLFPVLARGKNRVKFPGDRKDDIRAKTQSML